MPASSLTVPDLSIIFAGSGEFGLPTLQALLASGHHIVQVVSQPDRPAGRGKHLTPTPIAQFALQQGLPVLRTGNINNETLPPADVMVVIAFGQKIAEHIVNHPRLGSINLHASRLPKYRGAAPINWAIIRGESVTGNSIIRVAPKMDAGAILGQSETPIGETQTAGELHDQLAEDGAGLMLGVLAALASQNAVEVPQDDSQATLAPKLTRETARLDWTRPALELSRLIRGLSPWPGCRVRVVNQQGQETARVTLVRARPGAPVKLAPGQISDALTIAAGDGSSVEILEIQPEGKRPMPLDAYRNGHPWEPGMRVESL